MIPKVGETVAVALLMGLSIQLTGTLAWVAMIRLAVLYALIGASFPPVDMSPYPTTAIRFSALLMGPMVVGVVARPLSRC